MVNLKFVGHENVLYKIFTETTNPMFFDSCFSFWSTIFLSHTDKMDYTYLEFYVDL